MWPFFYYKAIMNIVTVYFYKIVQFHHTSHWKGFSPECWREWTFRDMLLLNDLPHVSQVNGISFVWAKDTYNKTMISQIDKVYCLEYKTGSKRLREKMAVTQPTNHVLAYMSHCVEFLLTNLTSVLFLSIAMNNLIVLMERPELPESFSTH